VGFFDDIMTEEERAAIKQFEHLVNPFKLNVVTDLTEDKKEKQVKFNNNPFKQNKILIEENEMMKEFYRQANALKENKKVMLEYRGSEKMYFTEWFVKFMKIGGFKQNEMAKFLNVGKSTMNTWINKGKSPYNSSEIRIKLIKKYEGHFIEMGIDIKTMKEF
jgi:DNA-binding transcriptional regulator YiaG